MAECVVGSSIDAEWTDGNVIQWEGSNALRWDTFFEPDTDDIVERGEFQKVVVVAGKLADPVAFANARSSDLLTMRGTAANVAERLRISEADAKVRGENLQLPGRFLIYPSKPSVCWWQVTRAEIDKFVN